MKAKLTLITFESLKLSTVIVLAFPVNIFSRFSVFIGLCSDKCLFDFFRPKVTINKQEAGELIDLSSQY
ncbi:unnamed protein product [Callosobruchus maculatus]|uniref:Uncharacterized protein n=1 Tax=Callosobruchus maculatus TaxID=64391 RepID=A0A653BRV8_CALMS|nr:unnamed protein product [Callosobruchus maculatus]